ncbi:MAG TPA: 6-phosphogluconolactonase [Rhodanobacteraceae bacterium]|nr:6-phosphogluconolactonase [Rhodanobacteraceae bacterium]
MNSTASRQVRWHGFADSSDLQADALLRIRTAATTAIAARGVFRIVLAGGNTPRAIYQALRKAITDWSRWQVYFGDERCLPIADPQRNSRMARDSLLDQVPIPRANIHTIPAELGASAGAEQYAQTLRVIGDFDLVLLGLGEDGHTASLFPDHDWGIAPDAPDTLAVFDAPKPPPERVSLSAARLSRARAVLFLVDGDAKREAVMQWGNGEHIPASAIAPACGVDVLTESKLL